jgi:hypothetical protein
MVIMQYAGRVLSVRAELNKRGCPIHSAHFAEWMGIHEP